VLVRDQRKADQLTTRYQHITSIIGDLDNLEVLESESRNADIVISESQEYTQHWLIMLLMEQPDAGPDVTHNAGIRAILKGLSGRSKKGYYIHTSGAASVWDKPDGSKAGTKVWDDIVDIETLTSMPEGGNHWAEDKVLPTKQFMIVCD